MSDIVYIPDPRPFWFVDSELLMNVLRLELRLAASLIEEHPKLREWFDYLETDTKQRKICFAVAAGSKVISNISDIIAGRCDPSGQLTKQESDIFRCISNLIASDAPMWVLEMERVIDRMPSHIYAALPESLRAGRFDENDCQQREAISAFGTLEQIQKFIQDVLNEQFERLAKRWTVPVVSAVPLVSVIGNKRRKATRTRDKQRMNRDRLIAEIADVSQQSMHEFLQLMDERKVPPQPTWSGWPGTWSKAYKDDRLRKLIHQDKSRAIARAKRKK